MILLVRTPWHLREKATSPGVKNHPCPAVKYRRPILARWVLPVRKVVHKRKNLRESRFCPLPYLVELFTIIARVGRVKLP